MCLALYIGSDIPLKPMPWSDEHPDLFLQELTEDEEPIRKILGKPHVQYVGTAQGCGCAFNYGREYPEYEYEAEEIEVARESRVKLHEILSNLTRETGSAIIYSCQESEKHLPVVQSSQVALATMNSQNFIFGDRELIIFTGAG